MCVVCFTFLGYLLGGKGGRCIRLTTIPPPCNDCLEILKYIYMCVCVGVCVVRFTLRPPYQRGKIPQNPLNKRLGGHMSQSRSFGKEKHLLLPTGVELRNLCCPALGQLYTEYIAVARFHLLQ